MSSDVTVRPTQPPIRVSQAARDGLERVIAAREEDLGRNVTLSEAIEFLVDFWENHLCLTAKAAITHGPLAVSAPNAGRQIPAPGAGGAQNALR